MIVFFAAQGVMFTFLLFFRGGCLEISAHALSKMLSPLKLKKEGNKRKVIDIEAKVLDSDKTKEYNINNNIYNDTTYDSKGQRRKKQ